MPEQVQIWAKPPVKEPTIPFEDLLKNLEIPETEKERLRTNTIHEKLRRAEYHRSRYLRHLTDDELHQRIGYMIANVTYVSSRNRYSTNNLYSHYWRDKIAHASEELAIHNCARPISSHVLSHLPSLGFAIPPHAALQHDPRHDTFFRYDKLQYIRKLQEKGEIYLRCASTPNVAGDVARNDENELCIELQMLRECIDTEFTPPVNPLPESTKTIALKMFQKTDYYMFCLSQGYDLRFFGDFSGGTTAESPEDQTACLVITNPGEFARRFALAAHTFIEEKNRSSRHRLTVSGASAYYYDPYDPAECAPLFGHRNILPFAKRFEYTYQHEFRFIIKPDVPEDYAPEYSPEAIPRFNRELISLGSLEDISYIIKTDPQTQEAHTYYLSNKNITLLASAIGVTLPNLQHLKKRFVYSVEKKEVGRTNTGDLTVSQRFKGGNSVQIHQQEIDIPVNDDRSSLLQALDDFYRIFDIREQGNHLIAFKVYDDSQPAALLCEYNASLACGEPDDDAMEASRVTFEFAYSFLDQYQRTVTDTEYIALDGHTYMAPNNGVGVLYGHLTHRSLLIAQMEFIRRLIAKGRVQQGDRIIIPLNLRR